MHWIDPAMPEALGPVRLGLQFRRNELEVEAAGNRLQIKSASGNPSDVAIGFRGSSGHFLDPRDGWSSRLLLALS
jgi:trehalose/maltose hydrolase-like predicted phosphorylase